MLKFAFKDASTKNSEHTKTHTVTIPFSHLSSFTFLLNLVEIRRRHVLLCISDGEEEEGDTEQKMSSEV
jgi:hypothetical protein